MMDNIAATLASGLAIGLGIWARMTFIRRSEIYQKNGKPVYRHATDCGDIQHACNRLLCHKIDEIKTTQSELAADLKAIRQFMGRTEQYMRDH